SRRDRTQSSGLESEGLNPAGLWARRGAAISRVRGAAPCRYPSTRPYGLALALHRTVQTLKGRHRRRDVHGQRFGGAPGVGARQRGRRHRRDRRRVVPGGAPAGDHGAEGPEPVARLQGRLCPVLPPARDAARLRRGPGAGRRVLALPHLRRLGLALRGHLLRAVPPGHHRRRRAMGHRGVAGHALRAAADGSPRGDGALGADRDGDHRTRPLRARSRRGLPALPAPRPGALAVLPPPHGTALTSRTSGGASPTGAWSTTFTAQKDWSSRSASKSDNRSASARMMRLTTACETTAMVLRGPSARSAATAARTRSRTWSNDSPPGNTTSVGRRSQVACSSG